MCGFSYIRIRVVAQHEINLLFLVFYVKGSGLNWRTLCHLNFFLVMEWHSCHSPAKVNQSTNKSEAETESDLHTSVFHLLAAIHVFTSQCVTD